MIAFHFDIILLHLWKYRLRYIINKKCINVIEWEN
jgi:hypothetical protein